MLRLSSPFRPAAVISTVIYFLASLTAGLHAVTLTAPPQTTVGRDSATIVWKTDVECGSRLNYGKTPDALTQRADGKVSAEHSVTVANLEPATTYHFAVGSARQRLATGSFTTLGANAPVATTPPAPPSKPTPGFLPQLLSKIGIGAPAPAPLTPKPAPPTRVTWANLPSLQDHFDRHGRDFRATSPDDYAAKAWRFREQARAAAWPMKLDADGTVRMWDGKSGSFAAYNRDGTTKTYFKPGNPSYWQRQPGRPITPAQLPFK